MSKLTSRIAVLALAAVLVACGTTTPTTAIVPSLGGDDGIATAEGLRGYPTPIDPGKCSGTLAVRELGAGDGGTKMEAIFTNVKGESFPCGGVSFAIQPDADLRNPRFNTNQVIVSGARGVYLLTASAYQSKVTVEVTIK